MTECSNVHVEDVAPSHSNVTILRETAVYVIWCLTKISGYVTLRTMSTSTGEQEIQLQLV